MLEKHLVIGAPSPLCRTVTYNGGAGGLVTIGVGNEKLGQTEYKYLPFVPNGINTTPMQGLDVVSSNFTGCIMATYEKDGVRYVCHVSTGDNQDCKAEWTRLKAGYRNVLEFRPSDFIETNGQPFVACYGLITNDLQTLSITIVSGYNEQADRKISAIKKAKLLRP